MTHVLSTSNLIDTRVVNPDGEDLGQVEEVLLDVDEGSVAYAVLSFGGFLGLGDKLFLIPWSRLALEQDAHRFVLDVPRENPGERAGLRPGPLAEHGRRELARRGGVALPPRGRQRSLRSTCRHAPEQRQEAL